MTLIPCSPSRSIVVSCARLKGSRYLQDDEPCGSIVYIRSTQDYLFCGLADGQGGGEYGAEGGSLCLEAVSDYIGSVGIGNLLNTPFPDELPCEIAKAFRRKLLPLAEGKNAGLKAFSSTLLAVAAERKSGKYLLLHLGNGCAVGVPHTGEPMVVSPPDCHTWLTTSDNAVSHLRVSFGSLENKKRLLLMSDGAKCFCRGKYIPCRTKDLLKNGSQLELHAQLVQSNPTEDAGCIFLDFLSEENRGK